MNAKKNIYIVETSENGTALEECASREAAESVVAAFEAMDELDGIYTPGFYSIRHGKECERIWNPCPVC